MSCGATAAAAGVLGSVSVPRHFASCVLGADARGLQLQSLRRGVQGGCLWGLS